eukprot:gene13992-16537_t
MTASEERDASTVSKPASAGESVGLVPKPRQSPVPKLQLPANPYDRPVVKSTATYDSFMQKERKRAKPSPRHGFYSSFKESAKTERVAFSQEQKRTLIHDVITKTAAESTFRPMPPNSSEPLAPLSDRTHVRLVGEVRLRDSALAPYIMTHDPGSSADAVSLPNLPDDQPSRPQTQPTTRKGQRQGQYRGRKGNFNYSEHMAGNRSQLNSRVGSRGGSVMEAGVFAQHPAWDASHDEQRFSAFSGLGDVPGHGANPQLGDTLDFELPPSQIPHSELKGYEASKGWFPNLEAFVSKSMQASSVDKHGLITWFREMFPHHKPVNRMDIQETDAWLHTHSTSICRRVQEYQTGLEMDRAAAAKKLQQEGKGEVLPDPEPVTIKLCWSKILSSSSPQQHAVPDQELNVLLAVELRRRITIGLHYVVEELCPVPFWEVACDGELGFGTTVRLLSETYSMANRELVRQVACTSKERAELMERLWYNSQTLFKPVLDFAMGLTPNYLEALNEVATLKAKLRSTHEEHSLVRSLLKVRHVSLVRSLLKDTEARLILLAREKNLLKKEILDKEGMVAQMSHGAVKTMEFDNIVTKYEQEHELRESLDFELGQKEDQLREMEERLEKALDENASLTEELKAAKDHLRIVTPRPEFNDRTVTDNLDDEELATTASRVEAYEFEIQKLRCSPFMCTRALCAVFLAAAASTFEVASEGGDQLAKAQAVLAKKEVEEKSSVKMEDVAQFLRGKRQTDARAQNSFSWPKLEAHLKEDENKGVPPRTHWFGLGDGKDFPTFLK